MPGLGLNMQIGEMFDMNVRRSKGFTLIELLIVVAIIGILAAIAIPNFLQAQTRAKVARAQSDLRNIGVAMEVYYTDHNAYPPRLCDFSARWYYGSFSVWWQLTTPIDYVSSGEVFRDPFRTQLSPAAFDVYIYLVNDKFNISACHTNNIPARFSTIRTWSAHSHGPDHLNNANYLMLLLYDPTNGTVSDGDIWLINGMQDLDASYQWP